MVQVAEHLSAAELQAGWRGSKDATLARHYQVIWLLAEGHTVAEVARLTGFVRRWVEELVVRYNRFGPSSLGDRRRGNGAKPRILTPEILAMLRERLQMPLDDGGVWTAKKVAAVIAAPACTGGITRRAGGVQKKLAEAVAEEAERHPGAVIEAFATDEHRIGLKPVLRRVWAPRGQRPLARGHHRFEWLYVTVFVSPTTGESFWYLATGVDKALFEETLALFAREAGAGRDRIIILVLDGAGWHTAPLAVPEGIRLVHLPPYTPELQPSETLWAHVDEPIANKHFDTLDDLDTVVAERCVALAKDRRLVRSQAGFHWWPHRVAAN